MVRTVKRPKCRKFSRQAGTNRKRSGMRRPNTSARKEF